MRPLPSAMRVGRPASARDRPMGGVTSGGGLITHSATSYRFSRFDVHVRNSTEFHAEDAEETDETRRSIGLLPRLALHLRVSA